MKKISIITILDNYNFGTYLQAFAIAYKIEQLGMKAEIVSYCRPGLSVWEHYLRSLKSTRNPLKWMARTIYAIKEHRLRTKDLKFVSQYLSPTRYHSHQELQANPPLADVYMTGSDQVWNSYYNHGIDPSFYLEYAPKDKKRVSYAASIGMKEIPMDEQKEMHNLLSKYNNITIREESAKDLLESIGIQSSKVHTVIDPTLLLNKKEWSRFIENRLVNEPYLLVYSVEPRDKNIEVSKIAQNIATTKGLKVVGVYYGGTSSRIPGCDKNFFRTTPDIFLSLMYHADFVVVSSFHGTAFSINFRKEFITVSPDRFNSRITNILNICNLQSRIIHNASEYNHQIQSINYNEVEQLLNAEVKKSTSILKELIQ